MSAITATDAQPYGRAQVFFHWITVGLIMALGATGMMYFWEIADGVAIRAHQVMGQILILVLAGRLVAKWRAGRRTASAHAAWERVLAGGVHIALYGAMVVALVSGYVAASALRDPTLLFPADLAFARSDTGELLLETHYAMKWILLGLVLLHVAGAVKHHVWDRDATLRNMISTR